MNLGRLAMIAFVGGVAGFAGDDPSAAMADASPATLRPAGASGGPVIVELVGRGGVVSTTISAGRDGPVYAPPLDDLTYWAGVDGAAAIGLSAGR